jgi:hypothetical protein
MVDLSDVVVVACRPGCSARLGGRSSAGMSAAAVSAKATQKVVANPRLDLTILDG